MTAVGQIGRALLDDAYGILLNRDEALIDAVSGPRDFRLGGGAPDTWTELGDWLHLASRLGAEKVLFLRGEPIVIFGDVGGPLDETEVQRLYRRAWSMSGPRCLFLALPDELRVYMLDALPESPHSPAPLPWKVIRDAAEVLALLTEDAALGPGYGAILTPPSPTDPARADRRLIEDLRYVRKALSEAGLDLARAHALIGRSILVRYLEDRGVLTENYFREVAAGHKAWKQLLDRQDPTPVFSARTRARFYDRVLLDGRFTSALFDRLAKDFNGDLFALGSDSSTKPIEAKVLRLLRGFLLGEVHPTQQKPLFFWAYDFEVVPLSLISSLYEEFYHDSHRRHAGAAKAGSDDELEEIDGDAADRTGGTAGRRKLIETDGDAGTHYTPASLVHDALHRTLTLECLATRPRILDLACGSGIFLVEAFRRIVRFESHQLGRELRPSELRHLLRDRISGVEMNAEAARVAAFSLYLALLDQQEPPDIIASGRLPHLIHSVTRNEEHYGIIIIRDAFALTAQERSKLTSRVAAKAAYEGRANDQRLLDGAGDLDLEEGSFDVVVGNPPWQEAPKPKKGTVESFARQWAASFGLPVGESSYSQLFIHRTLALLRPGGLAGLLVGMKVFWNDRETSRMFRRHLLARTSIRQILNMSHVRRVFFANAVAPFAFLLLENGPPAADHRFVIWNARRTRTIELLRSVSLAQVDRRVIGQQDVVDADYLWKTYWWGGHHDAALVARLALEKSLGDETANLELQPRYGWQRGPTPPESDVATLPELRSNLTEPYGPLRDDWFAPPPKGIKRDPDTRIYHGQRLVITRGVREPLGPVARLEHVPFSFRHTVYCVPLRHLPACQAKLVLGVMWSSLGRYRLFMSSGSWGGWHDQVTSRDVLLTPLRLFPSWGMAKDEHEAAVARIIVEVDRLRATPPDDLADLFGPHRPSRRTSRPPAPVPTAELDDAVFDLFEISSPERDLVEDFWAENHDLYWKGASSSALNPIALPATMEGTAEGIESPGIRGHMGRYLEAFLREWNPRLSPTMEFRWEIAASAGTAKTLAVAFVPIASGSVPTPEARLGFEALLTKCASALGHRVSPSFFVDRVIRVASRTGFVIVKSNMRRHWTASSAREDAEAMFLQLASTSKAA